MQNKTGCVFNIENLSLFPLLFLMVNLYNTGIRRGQMSKEAPAKIASLTLDGVHAAHLAKIFVVCNQEDTA